MSSDASDNPSGSSGGGTGVSAYRVLARKYRPRRFEELVGQEAMVRTLANAFESGRIAQGYMLTGVRGIGKTTTARLIARALNYSLGDKPSVRMDEMGEHCEDILESRHVDVIEIDAASHNSVENIREIVEQVRYRPIAARYKIYIMDEVHMLSKPAFNALLKTLEEPPEHVKFIFATTEIRKVPVTILSRCQRFDLRRVDAAAMIEHLKRICESEKVTAEEEALRLIARAAEGSVRDALSLLDQAIAHGGDKVRGEEVSAMLGLMDKARIIDLFEALMKGRMAEALEMFGEQHALGADPLNVLADLAAFTHLVTKLKVLKEKGLDAAVTEEERNRAVRLAEALPMAALTRAWQMLLKGMEETTAAPRPPEAAEMVLIRLAHAADMPPPGELVRKLREQEDRGAPGVSGAATASAPAPAAPSPSPSRGEAAPPVEGRHERESDMAPAPVRNEAQAAATTARKLPPMPEDFQQIVELAGRMRDLRIKDALERWVRPVGVSGAVLEIALEEGAPPELPGELGGRLSAWTGRRWTVVLSTEPGMETIATQERRRRDSLFARAENHPHARALLESFPQARIISVRPPENTAGGEPHDSHDDED